MKRIWQGKRVWKIWHVADKRWCFRGKHFPTRSEAERAIVEITNGKRDAVTNWFRINAVPKMTHV